MKLGARDWALLMAVWFFGVAYSEAWDYLFKVEPRLASAISGAVLGLAFGGIWVWARVREEKS